MLKVMFLLINQMILTLRIPRIPWIHPNRMIILILLIPEVLVVLGIAAPVTLLTTCTVSEMERWMILPVLFLIIPRASCLRCRTLLVLFRMRVQHVPLLCQR